MRFGYSYKTSDGIRHEDEFEAKTKEQVFASLRERGIKPIKVWEKRSRCQLSHRTLLIITLSLALVLAFAYIAHLKTPRPSRESATIVELRVKTAALINRHKAEIVLAAGDYEKIEDAVEHTREDARMLFKDVIAELANPDEQLEAKRLYGELMLLTDVADEEF